MAMLVNAEVSITGATTLNSGAFGKMHACSGTTINYTVGLPAVSGNAGKMIGFRMSPALTKLVTVDGNSSEAIDGALTRIMWANEAAVLMCDGTAWVKISGKGIPMVGKIGKTVALASNLTKDALTKVTLDTSVIDNTGAMVDTTNNRIGILRSGLYSATASIQYDANVVTGDYVTVSVQLNGVTSAETIGEVVHGYPKAYEELQASTGDGVTFAAGDLLYQCIQSGSPTASNVNIITGKAVNWLIVSEVISW